jgi:hypothetical protein
VISDRFQLDAVWKMIPSCLMWCLWRDRNDCSFEVHERTLVDLKVLFFRTLFHWAADSNIMNFHFF